MYCVQPFPTVHLIHHDRYKEQDGRTPSPGPTDQQLRHTRHEFCSTNIEQTNSSCALISALEIKERGGSERFMGMERGGCGKARCGGDGMGWDGMGRKRMWDVWKGWNLGGVAEGIYEWELPDGHEERRRWVEWKWTCAWEGRVKAAGEAERHCIVDEDERVRSLHMRISSCGIYLAPSGVGVSFYCYIWGGGYKEGVKGSETKGWESTKNVRSKKTGRRGGYCGMGGNRRRSGRVARARERMERARRVGNRTARNSGGRDETGSRGVVQEGTAGGGERRRSYT
ncbi:hypothetical protein C8J57DRAFT_1240079 [Mycena rebaudengoi]|nr:hypothetical protein C8J57DRAFT_1240079 [Mycena rebaudengoi]